MVWQQDGGIAGIRWWLSSETLSTPANLATVIPWPGTRDHTRFAPAKKSIYGWAQSR